MPKNKKAFVSIGLVLLIGCLFLLYEPRILKEEPTVAIVLGYNFFLKNGIKPYHYISKVSAILRKYSDLRYIIVSGANTHPGDSEKSEAQVLKEELEKQNIVVTVVVEERARTTRENIEFSTLKLVDLQLDLPRNFNVIIFSDVIQRPKVWWHANSLMSIYTISFFGISLWQERLLSLWSNF